MTIDDWFNELHPRVLPASWTYQGRASQDSRVMARIYQKTPGIGSKGRGYLRVITEVAEREGAPWSHVSMSHHACLPTWEEILEAKVLLLGDRLAIQVLPPKDEYINLHPYVLHLWCKLEGPRLVPDFRVFSPELGWSI